MKTIFTLLLVISMAVTSTKGQVIQSITVLPVNPTTNDTITVLADCMFFSGGCSDYTGYVSVIGSQIYANAIQCIGPLAFICNYTDTFKIDPLPAGNYTFHFQLDVGQGPGPCTPGIVAGPTDSVNFIVTLPVSTPEIDDKHFFSIYPNPARDEIQINFKDVHQTPVMVEIISTTGQIAKTVMMNPGDNKISLSEISAGYYFVRARKPGDATMEQKIPFTKVSGGN